MDVRTSIDSAVNRFIFLAESSDRVLLTASPYLRASLVKVVASEAAMKKSPSIRYFLSGGRS